eukprot:8728708-Alexandrium_andersonii.AAC.1
MLKCWQQDGLFSPVTPGPGVLPTVAAAAAAAPMTPSKGGAPESSPMKSPAGQGNCELGKELDKAADGKPKAVDGGEAGAAKTEGSAAPGAADAPAAPPA